MSVKSKHHVDRYVKQVAEMRAALANLMEFVESLPAPDDSGELPLLDYGHIGTVSSVHARIGELSQVADEMYSRGSL